MARAVGARVAGQHNVCSQSAATDLVTPIGRAIARILLYLLLEIQNIIIHQYPKPKNNLPAFLPHPKLAACPRRHTDDARLKSQAPRPPAEDRRLTAAHSYRVIDYHNHYYYHNYSYCYYY